MPQMIALLITLSTLLPQIALAELEIGSTAPKVTGVSEQNSMVKFEDLYKKGKVLVYFYPKAGTPGCTAQACSLRDHYAQLQTQGVTVVGISTDSVEAQKVFKEKQKLPFTLIADTKAKIAKAFGVSTFMSMAKRQAFLIIDAKIAWLDRKASTDKQADDVLKILETLRVSK